MEIQPGIGVLCDWFGGKGETAEVYKASLGKTISDISLSEDVLRITFSDGAKIRIWDNGQCCCESRYMRTDDDLKQFIGAKIVNMALEATEPTGDVDEIEFLRISTDKGVLTMSNHNDHNGYYGGFSVNLAND